MNHFDIIILGAGIAGSASAYQLSKTHKVLLLEQHEFLHKLGSSHGGSRIFRHAYEDERYVKLAQAAEESWTILEHDSDDKLLYRTGGLDIGPETYSEMLNVQKSLQKTSRPFDVLSPKETSYRFPAFQLAKDQVAIYQKDAGILAATRCLNAILRTAAQQGAILQDNEPVQKLTISDKQVEVKSSKGVYYAERLVICAGPAAQVMQELALPLQVEHQQVLYVTVKNGHLHTPRAMPIFINRDPKNDIYGFPLFDHPTAIKFSDHSGAKKINLHERNFDLDKTKAKNTLERAKLFLPHLTDEMIHFDTCLYTKTPDEHFILDLHPEYKNVALAGGFSGHGFKFGPVLGEIMAELVLHGKSKHDLSLFNLERYNS